MNHEFKILIFFHLCFLTNAQENAHKHLHELLIDPHEHGDVCSSITSSVSEMEALSFCPSLQGNDVTCTGRESGASIRKQNAPFVCKIHAISRLREGQNASSEIED
jgi:hypothetical protein